jgi:hypothetical protein
VGMNINDTGCWHWVSRRLRVTRRRGGKLPRQVTGLAPDIQFLGPRVNIKRK